jgi:hypothetical protein
VRDRGSRRAWKFIRKANWVERKCRFASVAVAQAAAQFALLIAPYSVGAIWRGIAVAGRGRPALQCGWVHLRFCARSDFDCGYEAPLRAINPAMQVGQVGLDLPHAPGAFGAGAIWPDIALSGLGDPRERARWRRSFV